MLCICCCRSSWVPCKWTIHCVTSFPSFAIPWFPMPCQPQKTPSLNADAWYLSGTNMFFALHYLLARLKEGILMKPQMRNAHTLGRQIWPFFCGACHCQWRWELGGNSSHAYFWIFFSHYTSYLLKQSRQDTYSLRLWTWSFDSNFALSLRLCSLKVRKCRPSGQQDRVQDNVLDAIPQRSAGGGVRPP